MTIDLHLTNLTSHRGFSEAALVALREHEGVFDVVANADPDGCYRDVWFRSTIDVATHIASARREKE